MSFEIYDNSPPPKSFYLTHKDTDLTLRFETIEEAEERAKVYYEQIPGVIQSISVGNTQTQELLMDDKELKDALA